jgi:RNA polymerase sigma-70 factor (ECF subfamily)
MMPEPAFADLLRRVVAGDQEAAAQLVRDYEPVIRREVRVRLRGDRARRLFDSLDICQSVLANFFVRAATGQFDLHGPTDLVKLLLTMTRNKLASRLRQQHRQRRDERRTVGAVERLGLAGPDPSPSRVVAGHELLQEARRRLTEEERQLAELRCRGLGWEEVAACLGGSPEARRKQLARALDRVASELGLDEA